MIGAILAAGLVSLTPYQKHQWFEGPDHPAIRPCRGALGEREQRRYAEFEPGCTLPRPVCARRAAVC